MTTAQESTNGHRVFTPPCPFPDPQEENQGKDSHNNFNSTPASPATATEAFPANAYHVPPQRYAPRANSYRYDDTLDLPPDTSPLPERCQFMFSDGRQCTMGRSEIHPSLCPYHSEREDQLFGTPSSGGSVVGAAFDLPELYSACRDLTTAAGVNRALGQVFRLLAQRRISRQEAATFAKLGHLLLQSISAARSEFVPRDNDKINESFPDERRAQFASRTSLREVSPEPSLQHRNGSSAAEPALPSVNSSAPLKPPAAASEPSVASAAAKNSFGMNTSASVRSNSSQINTSEIARFKVAQNQHLQNGGAMGDEFAPSKAPSGVTEPSPGREPWE